MKTPSMTDRTEIFRSMPIPKAIATMAIPTIISQMINLIYNMADAFYIGRTGNSYMVAAASICLTIYLMTIAFANLFGIGGGSLMARLAGRNEPEQARCVCAFCVLGAFFVAVLYSVLIFLFIEPILRFLGASDHSFEYARQYCMYVVVLGDVPVILSMTLAHLLRNSGYSKQASFGLSMGGVLNILLDPLFMFVVLPDGMEVTGAAIATLISNTASFIYLLIAAKKASSGIVCLNLTKAREISRVNIKGVFSVGVPSAVLTGLFDVGNVFLVRLMSVYGDLCVAALGIVMKIERVSNAINVGICQGTLPITAYNYASGDRARMKEAIRDSRIIGLTTSSICLVLLKIFASPFCSFFINTSNENGVGAAETVTIASAILGIRCLASPFQFMNFSNSYNMQALGLGGATLLHAVVRILVLYIPVMFILNSSFGMNGLVSALPVGEALSGIFVLILFRYLLKKTDYRKA